MTLFTVDAHKAGTTEVQVEWFFDDGNDAFAVYGRSATRATVAAAKSWASRNIPSPRDGGTWWCRVEEIRWNTEEFEDPETGQDVQDAVTENTGVEWWGTIVTDPVKNFRVEWEDWSA